MRPYRQSRMKVAVVFLFSLSLSLVKAGVAVGASYTGPIVDLHFHAEVGWIAPALGFPTLLNTFENAEVLRACNGVRRDSNPLAPDRLPLLFAQNLPDRYIAYGGQSIIRSFVLQSITKRNSDAWELRNPAVLEYLARLERQLRIGFFTGIGELFVNNLNSHPPGVDPVRFPANSPLMQRLWAFSATFKVPLSVHMEADPDSVEEMEELLGYNRKGTWLWAHGGASTVPELAASPSLLRDLLGKHPNLYIELSGRQRSVLDLGGNLREEWRNLLEEKSDRFVIGSDVGADPEEYARVIALWRNILGQLPDEAPANIAHLNADRLSFCDQRVFTDIKPGSFPNSLNPKSHGKIPVALLSTRLLDGTVFFHVPSRVDPASPTFGRTGDEDSLAFCNPKFEDVNNDGLLDLVCHFATERTGFQAGDTMGVLMGRTLGGAPLTGVDSVRIAPSK